LEKRIEAAKQAKFNIDDIRKACHLLKRNFKNLTFEQKRLALKALSIKVWIDEENVMIEGYLPIADRLTASTKLWYTTENLLLQWRFI